MRAISFNPEVEQLLAESQLPFDDVPASKHVLLFGHEQKGRLVGVVGVELYGTDALLRSLVVAPFARGTGLGVKLVSYAEQQAVATGASSIYLLTTTADKFFRRLGYSSMDRQGAPSAIASTTLFASLCPVSATFMVKQLEGSAIA